MRYSASDKIEDFTGKTVLEVEAAKKRFLEDAKKQGKAAVQRHIPKSVGKRRHINRKAMQKDIEARIVKDKIFGGKRTRIRGGRQTGRLWHILNDGTYRFRGTRFMDKALADMESGLDAALDAALSEEFKP